jgi:hypothetical protein
MSVHDDITPDLTLAAASRMLCMSSGKGGVFMSAVTIPATTWQWPADVLAFAAQHQVVDYLDPLRDATRRLFPTANSLRVFLECDPEIRDDWHIVFEVRAPKQDVPDFVQAVHSWTDEKYRICPAPLVCTFLLTLHRVNS